MDIIKILIELIIVGLVVGLILLTADVIGKYAWGWVLIAVGIIMAIGIFILSFVDVEQAKNE